MRERGIEFSEKVYPLWGEEPIGYRATTGYRLSCIHRYRSRLLVVLAPSKHIPPCHWRSFLFLLREGRFWGIDFFFEKQFFKGESARNFLKILSRHSTGIAPA
jgi:hypothetical protein